MAEANDIARREQYAESALERIADLEAEKGRLQWALREIVRIAPGTVSGEDYGAILAMRMSCIAGDALRTDRQLKQTE